LWQTTRLSLRTRSTNVARSLQFEVATRALVGVRKAGAGAGTVTLTGVVRPAAPQAQVSLQRRTRTGRWVPVARTGVSPLPGERSRYTVSVPRARRASVVRAVVLPNDGGAHARGVSRELRIGGRGR
ncbi:MAG: hypothetical protein MUF56_09920, partial [Solirubrobacteraceae bacterium]|nr:hypothetical protein [Solirubrobacteraceae bacterium]